MLTRPESPEEAEARQLRYSGVTGWVLLGLLLGAAIGILLMDLADQDAKTYGRVFLYLILPAGITGVVFGVVAAILSHRSVWVGILGIGLLTVFGLILLGARFYLVFIK